MSFNVTTKIYAGFGAVLLLVMLVAAVGAFSLSEASDIFVKYRTLARQTNADGRVQANMLMTRIFAKNFVISATPENIDGVNERARRTLEMIKQASTLNRESAARNLLVEDLQRDLRRYVSEFGKVTEWQAERNQLVNERLNELGPKTEQTLTQLMQSALDDGDTTAAYQAGVTLRNLMLGRLYATRFLIQNDDASVDRAMREFRDMEINVEKLLGELQDPARRELAGSIKDLQGQYMSAFVQVRRVIGSRNILIKHQLDRIGPEVADRIERLKLAIKHEQDQLGPVAQATIIQAETVVTAASIAAIIAGILLAGWIATGIARPIRSLTTAAEAMAAGNLDQDVDTSRVDEIGTLATAFVAMRSAIEEKVHTLQSEIAERTRAEENLAQAQQELRRTNENLEETVKARTQELTAKEAQLRIALTNMSDGIFTLDGDGNYNMFNDRYAELCGLPGEVIAKGVPVEKAIRHAAELRYYGGGETDDIVRQRMASLKSQSTEELESETPEGRVLNYRKSPMADGGAVVVVSDVTERRKSEEKLSDAFKSISSSINYASRIQKSILPAPDFLSERFEDHFVIWEPRDVVGGDVYWCHSWGQGELVLLGDCTGHGVPGAFMTLISTGALERAMAEVDPGDVSALVQRMHQLVRQSLGQDGHNASANDGLELGVCYVEPTDKRITFVGARFDLFVVKDGAVDLIRSTKKGIGYPEVPPNQVFEPTVVEVPSGTQIYMTTDGAVDQIDGEQRRRFGKQRFKDLLTSVQELPMAAQGQKILDTIRNYQGSAPRLDDIAVVGFNIG